MTDDSARPDSAEHDTPTHLPDDTRDGEVALEALVGRWLTVPELAEALGVSPRHVRGLVSDRALIMARVGPNRALAAPADVVVDGQIHPDLAGTYTVLADGGMDDEEILRWLYTTDPTLPAGPTPMANILAGRKKEVRRRAMELAL